MVRTQRLQGDKTEMDRTLTKGRTWTRRINDCEISI